VASFAVVAVRTGGVSSAPRLFQISYLAACGGYWLLLSRIRRAEGGIGLGRWTLWLAGMILLRVTLAGTSPSDDVYRYVWEGRVQQAGLSPYVVPPDDARLSHLRDDAWTRINHPDFPAIYPPLAQLQFRLAAAIHPSVYLIKGIHVVWDVLIVAVLAAMLRRRGRTPHLAAAYGLCPLVLAAFAVEGHLDSLMLLLTLLSIEAFDRRRLLWAGIALGSAVAAKTIVLALLPWFILRSWRVAVIALAVTALWYVPFGTTGLDGLANLLRFGEMEEFFSFLGSLHVLDLDTDGGRLAAVAGLVATCLLAALRMRDVVRYGMVALSAVLLTLPVVHYWYVTWVLAFTPLAFRWAWPIAAAAFATYFEAAVIAEATGTWLMPAWTSVVTWVIVVVTFAVTSTPTTTVRRGDDGGEPAA